MLERILIIIFPLFFLAGAGWAYGRVRRPDMTLVNRLNMEVFVPALVFGALSGRDFELVTYGWLAAGVVVVVLVSGLAAAAIARAAGIEWRTFAPPMMFGNTGNLGLPLAAFAFGDAGLPGAVTIFVASSTLHFSLGAYILNRQAGVLHVFRIPMIQATLAGLAFSLAGWHLPEFLATPIDMLGRIAPTLMLFSLGVRMVDMNLSDWRIGALGAVVSPAVGVVLAAGLLLALDLPELQARQLLVFGALPPAVLNYIFAESYRQEPARVASIVMLGNLFSVASIPAVLAWVLR